ncbi:MAG TPA: MATE family efflux transporter [Bacteroidales bacterium]|nr:MATE family efflux transporter [Bacteroidales bacterium]
MPPRLEFINTPIPLLIRRLAIPTSVGFFFNTMFNVVDTIYAGQISTLAQAGLAISFPVFFIILSVGMGIGTGTTALIANALGRRNLQKARMFARQAITFGFLLSLLLSVVGYLVVPYLFRFMNATGEYLQLALDYMNVILISTVTFLLNGILNGILSSRGDARSYRNVLVVGSILNIGFDPLLLFGWGPFPAMGIQGIALSTVLIQAAGLIYMGYRVSRTELFIRIRPRYFIPRKEYFKEIAQQGFPASLNMMTVAIGIFIITWFISGYGNDTVAAYGIATRIEQIALLPTIGLNIAVLAIVGQNFGAGHYERVHEAYRKSLKYGAIIMGAGMVWVFLLSDLLMKFFTVDPPVIGIGATYLKIAVMMFYSYVLLNVSVAALQGMKKPMFAVWIGLFRQVVMPITLFGIFSWVMKLELTAIWWGLVAINWTAAIFAVIYVTKKLRKIPLVASQASDTEKL